MKKYLFLLLSLLLAFTMVFGSVGMAYAEGEEPGTGDVTEPELISFKDATVTLGSDVFRYDGSQKKPSVTVMLGDKKLKKDTDYTVQYFNNVKVGTGYVKVTGIESAGYTKDTVQSQDFYILGAAKAPTLIKKGQTYLKFSWPKYTEGPADGYIVYEYDKATKTNKQLKKISGLDKNITTISNLTPGSEHRIRIAVYKKDSIKKTDVTGAKSSYLYMATNRISIAKATVKLEYKAVAYNGYYKKPKVKSVKLKNGTVLPSSAYSVSYSNNKNSGWATVTVTAKDSSKYKGSIKSKFYIVGKMDEPSASSVKTTSLTLKWKKHPGSTVEGYKVYKKNSKGEYIRIKTIKGIKNTSFTVTGLSSKKAYRFKVAAYMKDPVTGKTVIGKQSSSVLVRTLPATPKKQSISLSLNKPYIKVKWKKTSEKRASSFEIMYSTNSSFDNAKTETVKNDGKVTSYTIENVYNNTRYYVKVRSVNSYNGHTVYGKWSSSDSIVADSSGWCTIKGRKYYYSNGSPLKGNHIINGEHYYFDGVTGECHGVSSITWDKVKNVENSHPYLVSICITKHRINIFKKIDGDWVMTNQWSCTTGTNDDVTEAGLYTPRGDYKVRFKVKSFGDTYTVWYATNFHNAFYIHSILYNHGSMTSIQDGRLGISASHGCVRTSLSHAKWIYENVKTGSAVICVKF